MGSGRGKTRRAMGSQPSTDSSGPLPERAVKITVPPQGEPFHQEEWNKFVKYSKLKPIGVQQYYLGKQRVPKALSDVECEQLLLELLADGVSVGAIALPDPYKIEDFEIKLITNKGWLRNAKLSVKGKTELHSEVNYSGCLDENASMANKRVIDVLHRLSLGLNAIDRKSVV